MTEYPHVHGLTDRVVFSRTKSATYGDPVRVTSHQGLFRLVGMWPHLLTVRDIREMDPSDEPPMTWYAEVIGPYYPTAPHKNRELSRVFPVEVLKHAGKATRGDVAMSPAASAISEKAKQRKR